MRTYIVFLDQHDGVRLLHQEGQYLVSVQQIRLVLLTAREPDLE